MIATALLTVSAGILRPKTTASLRPRVVLKAAVSNTATVLMLTPPAMLAGAAPMNINTMMVSWVVSRNVSSGMMVTPADQRRHAGEEADSTALVPDHARRRRLLQLSVAHDQRAPITISMTDISTAKRVFTDSRWLARTFHKS